MLKLKKKPIELFNNLVIDQKLDYLHQSMVKADMVDFAEDYWYSSAKNYVERVGLIEMVECN